MVATSGFSFHPSIQDPRAFWVLAEAWRVPFWIGRVKEAEEGWLWQTLDQFRNGPFYWQGAGPSPQWSAEKLLVENNKKAWEQA